MIDIADGLDDTGWGGFVDLALQNPYLGGQLDHSPRERAVHSMKLVCVSVPENGSWEIEIPE